MSSTVHLLRCGTLTAPRSMFEQGLDEQPLTLPVPSWLIRHDDHLVLIDCGMHEDLVGPSDYLDSVSLFYEVGLEREQLVADALRQIQVDPADIDVVVLTHLHFDHVGGLHQVPNARVVVQPAEWSAGADDDEAAANAFVTGDYRLGHDVVTVDGEHDLFGDGAITCLPTPGHTPGHQSVRVRLSGGDLVLCADCADFERTLDGGPLPPFGHDLEQHAASIQRLRAMRASGARLLPGHDPTVLGALASTLA